MAKETRFEHPPRGHIAVLGYEPDHDDWYALHIDEDGVAFVEVVKSALPGGAATSDKQDTMITALQLIDDLRNALDSVGLDELDVNIEDSVTLTVQSTDSDKIFSYESIVEEALVDTNLGAGTNTVNGTAVPSGKVDRITAAYFMYVGTSPTAVQIDAVGLATVLTVIDQQAPSSGVRYPWSGEIHLQAGDYMRVRVVGATAGDDIYMRFAGTRSDAP